VAPKKTRASERGVGMVMILSVGLAGFVARRGAQGTRCGMARFRQHAGHRVYLPACTPTS
jgi:hypothetical protein